MRRILSLLFAIICIFSSFSLVSCDDGDSVEKVAKLGGKTPVQVMDEAIPGLKDFIYDENIYIEYKINASIDEQRWSNEFIACGREGYYKISRNDDVNEITVVDGMIYVRELDEKYKMTLEYIGFEFILEEFFEEVEGYFSIVDSDEYDYAVYMVKESGLLDELKFEKSGSKYTLKLDLVKLARKALDNPDAIADVLPDELLEEFNEAMENKAEFEQMLGGIEKALITIRFNGSGVITSISVQAKGSISIEGQCLVFDANAKASLSAALEKNKIKAPADADEYESYTGSR